MPGRKPLPPEVKDVTGDARHHRPYAPAPQVDTGPALKPAYLRKNRRASKIWDELEPALTTLGTLRAETAPGFARWCQLEAQFQKNPDAFPASRIANMRAYESMLGMDPSTAGRFAKPKANADQNPTSRFFNRPRIVQDKTG